MSGSVIIFPYPCEGLLFLFLVHTIHCGIMGNCCTKPAYWSLTTAAEDGSSVYHLIQARDIVSAKYVCAAKTCVINTKTSGSFTITNISLRDWNKITRHSGIKWNGSR